MSEVQQIGGEKVGRSLSPLRREIQVLTRLALPVMGAQVLSVTPWMVDLLMVGRLGVEELDVVSLGRTWIMATVMVGTGLILGMDPVVSQAWGAKDRRRGSLALQRGLVIALLCSIPVALSWSITGWGLKSLGQDPHLSLEAGSYVWVQVPGLPFYFAFLAVRQWLQGRGIMRPSLVVALLANVVNVLANAVLIFGYGPVPALGTLGAGIATALTQVFMLAAVLFMVWRWRLHRGGWEGWSRQALKGSGLREILGFGWPVALHLLFELWAFAASTLLAGRLGSVPLAAHTIVINLATLSFMVPLGLAIAAVTRVGNLVGARRLDAAQRSAHVALVLGGGVMIVSALVFLAGRWVLPGLYTSEMEVLALCAAILPIAATFQIFDGVQVVAGGVLRGMGKTRPPALANFVAYYVLALPLGAWWAFDLGLGLKGLWWAMCLGLGIVAIWLCAWVLVRGPRTLSISLPTAPSEGGNIQ
ncbi:MAG: MATE family efflux transporter [Acidobacteriota bacterium]